MRWKFENTLKKNNGGVLLEDDTMIILNKRGFTLKINLYAMET